MNSSFPLHRFRLVRKRSRGGISDPERTILHITVTARHQQKQTIPAREQPVQCRIPKSVTQEVAVRGAKGFHTHSPAMMRGHSQQGSPGCLQPVCEAQETGSWFCFSVRLCVLLPLVAARRRLQANAANRREKVRYLPGVTAGSSDSARFPRRHTAGKPAVAPTSLIHTFCVGMSVPPLCGDSGRGASAGGVPTRSVGTRRRSQRSRQCSVK